MTRYSLLLLMLAVTVSVEDNYTIRFSSASDTYWFAWSKSLVINGEEARELHYRLMELFGTDDGCNNLNIRTGKWSIGPCKGEKP